MVKNKDKNLTTKTPRALSFTKKNRTLTGCFLVFLGALGVLVVKHLKLTDG